MIAYHYTLKTNLPSILANGLMTGKKIGLGEKINAVLVDTKRYHPIVGNFVYLKINIDKLNYRFVNDNWVEVYETIDPSRILAIANPPVNNADAIELFLESKEKFEEAFQYQKIQE